MLRVPEDAGRACAVALTFAASPGLPLPDGRVVPVTLDPIFFLSTDPAGGLLSSATGLLDSSGQFSTTLTIPPLPITGFQFYALGVTLDPLAVAGIQTIINPPLHIVLQ